MTPGSHHRIGLIRSMTAMVLSLFVPIILYDQNKEQLPTPDLRALNYKRAALAQFCVGLEQNLFFFVELQVDRVARVAFALSVDVQREIFARGQPIFLTRLQCFAGLADDLELIVSEKFLQRLFHASQ